MDVSRPHRDLRERQGQGGQVLAAERRTGPGGARGLAFPVLLGVLFLLAAWLDWPPWLRGPAPYPPEWQWRRVEPAGGPYLPVLLAAGGLAALLAASGSGWVRRRPRAATRLLLSGGTLLGWGFALALLGLQPGGAIANLAARVTSRAYTSYHTVAVSPEAADPIEFLRRHAELLPAFRTGAKHAATHPPGPVLFYRGLVALCEASPRLTDALLAARGQGRPLPTPGAAASRAAAILGGLLLTLLGVGACWPIASLAGRLAGDPLAGTRAGLLWAFVPGPAVMVPQFDQALALPVAGAAALLAAAVASTGRGWWLAALAGALGGVALFTSYGAAAFLAVAGLAALAGAAGEAGSPRRALGLAVVATAVAAGAFAATALFGHEPLRAALTALAIHHEDYTALRSYRLWLAFNPLDAAVFLGPPLATLAAGRAIRASRSCLGLSPSAADRFTAALVLGLGILWLSGASRGEVGRIWIPLMPSLLAAAVARPAGAREAGPTRAEALVLGPLLAATCLVLRSFWDL